MKAIRLVVLGTLLLCWVPQVSAQVDLPPAAKEVLKQFEDESATLEKKIDAEIKKSLDRTLVELKKVQDQFCKDAKLDEAVAVRDLIRSIQAGSTTVARADLPAAAKEVWKQHEDEIVAVQRKAEADIKKTFEQTVVELKKVQDQFCKDAKLDEAVAVRDLLRGMRDGVLNVMADPGYVNNQNTDIGKVFYYEVTGMTAGQSIYGTDVYTTGSYLAMAAVHCGVLKDGQKGVVKVTILPGQASYPASTSNGITSYGYGAWSVSFKVERTYRFLVKTQPNPDR